MTEESQENTIIIQTPERTRNLKAHSHPTRHLVDFDGMRDIFSELNAMGIFILTNQSAVKEEEKFLKY